MKNNPNIHLLAAPNSRPKRTPLPPDTIPLYDSAREIACPECSHHDCTHFHLAQRRLSRPETQGFLRFTENTLFTKHSRGEMPKAVAGPPLEFCTCQIAVYKYDDGLILTGRSYDRAEHLNGVPVAHAARIRKEQEKRAKLSAAMRRRHAATKKRSARLSKADARTMQTTKKGGTR